MNPAPRLLGFFHLYPPTHNAGGEWMAHTILRTLRDVHGWDVRVMLGRLPRRNDTFEGIPVEMIRDPGRRQLEFQWADVAITHLDVTRDAMRLSRRTTTPLVHLLHNDAQLQFHRVSPGIHASLVVPNSDWLSRAVQWQGERCTVIPPVFCDDYTTERTGDAVTLVNLTAAKGADAFFALAERMPDVQFLGVSGAYGAQLTPPPDLANVTVLGNQPDIRTVWERTRVLVMPSAYESWGRCAVEAAAAGIPTVAAPTPGLVETGVPCAFMSATTHDGSPWRPGGFRAVGEPDLDAWEVTLRRLLEHEPTWQWASQRAQRRARELEGLALSQIGQLDAALRALAGR